MIFAPAPDLCEVFVVELDPKTDAGPAQKIEKPDARQTEHLGRWTASVAKILEKVNRCKGILETLQ